jgi:predicted TIM-barrel fold metal-dependent hydrolase
MVNLMDKANIEKCVISTGANTITSEIISLFPNRVVGFAHLSAFDGMRAVRELERLVREEGFRGLSVASLYDQVRASDARYYPLYAKCVELGIPVRIYTAMTYANDRPYELGHPRELDRVAIDFPELKMIAGLAGWPWINDIVGLLRRHPNLYADTAAHRPRHFATKGSGWEQFLQFGNTLLQDKIMVGLSWSLLGLSMEEAIKEYLALPLKDSVKEKWMYHNAVRFFGFG